MDTDPLFTGPIPDLYDRYLGPILFQPFAKAIAERLDGSERDVLETAAGTGIVTRAMLSALPGSIVTATDLNQAMLDSAALKTSEPHVTWQQANAQSLPFEDRSFDVVVCSFGVMFMPDRPAAYREAKRVLRAGGRFILTVFDRIEDNPLAFIPHTAMATMFPDDPPRFLRTPYAYHDKGQIEQDLRAAGFTKVTIEDLHRQTNVVSASEPAIGQTQGTPLRGEIEARDPARLLEATNAVAAALRERFGEGSFQAPLHALLVTAS
jgi:ubiquinone/menaquinone biosynthesis C-methylase UbiE